MLTWVAFYYYWYCYHWNTTLKKKMLSVNFYKNEKMFQIDLNSDLKKELDLKSRCCFTLLWTDLNPNVGKYTTICVTLWICLNIRQTTCLNKLGLQTTLNLPIYCVQRLEYSWVCLKRNVPKYTRVLNAWTRINMAE